MSRIIASAAIRGAHKYVKEADEKLNKLIEEKGEKQEIGFPNTAYYLPLILALLGIEVKTLADAKFYLLFPLINFGFPTWVILLTQELRH